METTLQAGIASAGTCTRLAFQAMPHRLTMMLTGFLQTFLMYVPSSFSTAAASLHARAALKLAARACMQSRFMPCGLVRATHSDGPTEDDPPIFGFILYLFTCILLLGVDEVRVGAAQRSIHPVA